MSLSLFQTITSSIQSKGLWDSELVLCRVSPALCPSGSGTVCPVLGAGEHRPLLAPQPVSPRFLLLSLLLVNVKAVLSLLTQAEATGLQLPRQQNIFCSCHTSCS